MQWHTWIRAWMMASERGDYVTIGGGEPTLHKLFARMIEYADEMLHANTGVEGVYIITNGSRIRNTMKAVAIMEEWDDISNNAEFHIVLSANDGFHDWDKMHPKVYNYFATRQKSERLRGRSGDFIRTVAEIMPQGRAVENGIATRDGGCCCEDLFVRPNGDVHACGCLDSPKVGDVHSGVDSEKDWAQFGCWRDAPEREEACSEQVG